MKVISAFLLAKLGGNENPTTDDLKKILESVGAEIDLEKINLLLSLVKDRDVTELMAVGKEKMAALSYGCLPFAMVKAGGDDHTALAAEAVVESKKEVEEEEDDDLECTCHLWFHNE